MIPQTVLAVDDNDAIRYSVARRLRDAGFHVIEAGTGAEALRLARQDPVLITLDINLPDIDGFEVCRRLKDDPATREIPVLHLSASCIAARDKVRGLEGGADAYLSEPIDPQELLATVKALLRMREAQREARRQADEAERAKQELKDANESLEMRVHQRTAELEQQISEVQKLSGALLQAQDEERRRISRELHDSTGQLLVALKLNVAQLKSEMPAGGAAVDRLVQDTESVLEEMSRQLRSMSYLLHPPLLDEAGLESALRWYVDGFARRSSLKLNLELPADLARLPQSMETTIFRLVQESLTNIHRHSGSKTGLIRLVRKEREVQLEIIDKGTGFSFEAEMGGKISRPGVGIIGMKERVHGLGGSLQITSSSSGTRVFATLPIQPD
ncbi:MAG TPA: response regulator [Candidatus Sulfotelmatobacter sp.]|nr:response regulator [Candidatus Sulfotelmatobacter sp.]